MAVMASWSRLLTPENSYLHPIKPELSLVLEKRENHCLQPVTSYDQQYPSQSYNQASSEMLNVMDGNLKMKPTMKMTAKVGINLLLIEILWFAPAYVKVVSS